MNRWATQRKVFGKPLISQAVIRAKIAGMIARTEAIQSWLENVTYQMCNMQYKEQAQKLAGQIAFLKMLTTSWLRHVVGTLNMKSTASSHQAELLIPVRD